MARGRALDGDDRAHFLPYYRKHCPLGSAALEQGPDGQMGDIGAERLHSCQAPSQAQAAGPRAVLGVVKLKGAGQDVRAGLWSSVCPSSGPASY